MRKTVTGLAGIVRPTFMAQAMAGAIGHLEPGPIATERWVFMVDWWKDRAIWDGMAMWLIQSPLMEQGKRVWQPVVWRSNRDR